MLDRQQAGKTAQEVLGFGGDSGGGLDASGLALRPTAVLIGIAPLGGRLAGGMARAGWPRRWTPGCDLWSGLHTFLGDDPMLAAKAKANGRRIYDLRKPPADLPKSPPARPRRSSPTWCSPWAPTATSAK